jgi:hypothetical protein
VIEIVGVVIVVYRIFLVAAASSEKENELDEEKILMDGRDFAWPDSSDQKWKKSSRFTLYIYNRINNPPLTVKYFEV